MRTKTFLAVGIVIILVLVGLAGCSAAKVPATEGQPVSVNVGSQQTGIWVNGTGKVTLTPDIATLSLGVSAQTSSVAEAQSQASTAMDKVMAALKGNGVAQKDIQTQYYNVQQVTRWDDKSQLEVVIGFRVSNMVIAKIREMAKIGSIIDAVVAAGGDLTRINGINFSVEKPEQYYSQARELAMNDAKAKAQQIASLSGVTLGKPTFISENASAPPVPYPQVMYKGDMAAGAAPSVPISTGEMDIVLNVQVTYTIQ
jgi:uncharacterized protein YggE